MKRIIVLLSFVLFSCVTIAQNTEIYRDGGALVAKKTGLFEYIYNPLQTNYYLYEESFRLYDNVKGFNKLFYYSDIADSTGTLYGGKTEVVNFLNSSLSSVKLESDGSTSVTIQDQTTDPIIIQFNRIDNSTTLIDTAFQFTNKLVLTSTTGADVGDFIIIFNATLNRFYKGTVLSIDTDSLFMDNPLDVTYPPGSFVDITTDNLAVNGATIPKIYGLRGVSESPIGLTVDITRIIFYVQTSGAVDLSTFGDIAGGITKGLLLRKRDGRTVNIFNIKTNAELAGIAYDWTPFSATNPQQGQNGFIARLTFAGQNKIGVAIRLQAGEDLEFLIQDNLSTITSFQVVAEGHIVE